MFKERKSAIRWIFNNAKPILGSILFLTLIGVFVSYISVEFAMATRLLLDSATGASEDSFSSCIIRLAVLLVVELAAESIYNLYEVRLSARYRNKLQCKLFTTIMTRDFTGVNEYHSGELINRLTGDIDIINSNIIGIVPALVTLVTGVVFSFVAMMKLDLSLSLICLALGPVVLLSSALYGRRMKKLHAACRASDGKTRSFMQECIQNIMALKAFGSERKAAHHASLLQYENYKLNMKRGYISLFVNILYYVALTVAYYFAVAWCAYKISAGLMTVGVFTAIVQLVNSIQQPFRQISGTVSQFFATCASAERIMEIESIDEDEPEGNNIADFTAIDVSKLKFAYDDEVIFDDASFTVNKGDIAVISGSSGKGKTTLFKLLLGILKPHAGELCIYNKEEKISIGSSTRSLFAYVPQGNMIISGTIRKNIAFFDDNPDPERVEEAARLACILDYINTLPEGMDTVLGENGLGLSEGQVQRLAIARALYLDAPVILLDESTSALDDETEAQILQNIKSLKNKTCIIISHRAAAFDIATRKIHLSDHALQTTM